VNKVKHGVSFEEALTVFADPFAHIIEDAEHSESEHREIIIGHSTRQILMFVNFVEVADDKIRLISARVATARERKEYEEDANSSGQTT
jgi:uncharacterized DUF497 family protein